MLQRTQIQKRPCGFSLIDMLIGLAVIALLAVAIVPQFYSFKRSAYTAQGKLVSEYLAKTMKGYHRLNDRYPTWRELGMVTTRLQHPNLPLTSPAYAYFSGWTGKASQLPIGDDYVLLTNEANRALISEIDSRFGKGILAKIEPAFFDAPKSTLVLVDVMGGEAFFPKGQQIIHAFSIGVVGPGQESFSTFLSCQLFLTPCT